MAALLTADTKALLADSGAGLAAVEPWMRRRPNKRSAPLRNVKAQNAVPSPSRGGRALTGRTTSPGLFEVLAVLGKAKNLARVADQTGAQSA